MNPKKEKLRQYRKIMINSRIMLLHSFIKKMTRFEN